MGRTYAPRVTGFGCLTHFGASLWGGPMVSAGEQIAFLPGGRVPPAARRWSEAPAPGPAGMSARAGARRPPRRRASFQVPTDGFLVPCHRSRLGGIMICFGSRSRIRIALVPGLKELAPATMNGQGDDVEANLSGLHVGYFGNPTSKSHCPILWNQEITAKCRVCRVYTRRAKPGEFRDQFDEAGS